MRRRVQYMSQSADIEEIKVTGWIPVVSGNMSFTEIGKTRESRRFEVLNEVAPAGLGQTILIFGKKSLSDGWLPPWLRRRLESIEARFYFLLVLRSVPKNSRSREVLEGAIALSINESILKAARNAIVSNIHEADTDLSKLVSGDSFAYDAKVRVTRDGRCDIAMSNRHTTENALEIARQFFIFIKDVAHHHYHHGKSDSITYAHMNDDDMEWRKETLYSLHRAMVSARRYVSQQRLRSALGISAYAETFESGFLAEGKLPKGMSFSRYSYEPIQRSIASLVADVQQRTDRRLSNVIVATSVILAFVALIIAAKDISGVKNAEWPGWVLLSMTLAIEHTGAAIVIAAAVLVAALTFAGQDNVLNRPGLRLGNWFYRRFAFLGKEWITVILGAIGGSFLYLSYRLLEYFWALAHFDASLVL